MFLQDVPPQGTVSTILTSLLELHRLLGNQLHRLQGETWGDEPSAPFRSPGKGDIGLVGGKGGAQNMFYVIISVQFEG